MNKLILLNHHIADARSFPIKVYTFGRFGMTMSGKPLQFTRKAQQKPLDLLKALISMGGRDVPVDKLMDAIWNNSDGDSSYQNFKTTLFRLRQLLEIKYAVSLWDGKVSLDAKYCYVDLWAFERCLGIVDCACVSGNGEAVVMMMDRAMLLYKGHFLNGDVNKPWAVSMRERLKSRLFRHVINVCSFLEEMGQPEKAVCYYQKALEIDDLAEECYRRLMICYHHQGLISEAISVYLRCKRILSTTIEINPSPETEAVYRKLMINKMI